jgi:FixJ family two-component response regulator
MAETTSTVVVIDDDPAIRESIGGLLRPVGLQARKRRADDRAEFEHPAPHGPLNR